MSSDLSEIDVFAEGIRPPTIFEHINEWAEEKGYALCEIGHRITTQSGFGGMFLEEAVIELAIPRTFKATATHPHDIAFPERVVIGMQGPGTIHPRKADYIYTDESRNALRVGLKGVITYDG